MTVATAGDDTETVNAEDGMALRAEGICKAFRAGNRHSQALQNVSLQARQGLVTGLIGPDGAGKTTLMRLAVGLLQPDSGEITVLDKDIAKQSLAVQGLIGYMPQRFGLYEDLTVQENLDLYADLQGVPKEIRRERYGELIHMAGLTAFKGRLAGQLSGGMKQKLGLACALVRQPALLLLDEPTVGVDPLSRRELWSIIYRLVQEKGTSVLLSTAYLDEAERCNEVFLLHNGTLLDHGPPSALREPLRGRTYALTAPDNAKRPLQSRLSHAPDVLDALIQGDHIRLVMDSNTPPDPAVLLPDVTNIEVAAVAPRFEDSFVALLKQQAKLEEPQGRLSRSVTSSKPTAPGSGQPMIEVHDLQRSFGTFKAVKGISFSVSRGEVFGLLGANGAGKSTTFRMLCGLLPPSGGKLRVAGVDLRRAAAAARERIGYMSQKFSLYSNLTVMENLRFFASAYGLSGAMGRDRVDHALQDFSLISQSDSVSGDLSLGYKQRLALACALMHEPDILFLDEPTSGVDPLARREFWLHINDLAEQGVTIMVTTHFMEEAEYCDRLAIMAAGEILTIGAPAAIKATARTADLPEPTMEDAFVALIQGHEQAGAAT